MGLRLFKVGLVVLIASLVFAIVAEYYFPGLASAAPGIARAGLFAGAAMCAAGLVLWLLGRGAAAVSQRRCVRCGKPVYRGATYCLDHLKESVDQARDKTHRFRGTGV